MKLKDVLMLALVVFLLIAVVAPLLAAPAGSTPPPDTRRWILPDGKIHIGDPDGVRFFNGRWWKWDAKSNEWLYDDPRPRELPATTLAYSTGIMSGGACAGGSCRTR